uniref:Uncharacterized protein n=1 Tax=Glaesserella parasuis TaxID=738 RepID=F1CNF1_GLAPU|nr:hypothetical protein [Glaesserella parasuis]
MKKYVLLLVAVLSAAISVTGLANSSSVSTPSLEATVKMFKPENQSLAREFLTTVKSDKEYVQELATLINKEFGKELLYVGEYKGKAILNKHGNVNLTSEAEKNKMATLEVELNKVLDEMAEKDKKNEGVFWSKGAQVNIAETKLKNDSKH